VAADWHELMILQRSIWQKLGVLLFNWATVHHAGQKRQQRATNYQQQRQQQKLYDTVRGRAADDRIHSTATYHWSASATLSHSLSLGVRLSWQRPINCSRRRRRRLIQVIIIHTLSTCRLSATEWDLAWVRVFIAVAV